MRSPDFPKSNSRPKALHTLSKDLPVLQPVPGDYLVQPSSSDAALREATEVMEKRLSTSSYSRDLTLPFYSFAVKVLPDRDAKEETEKIWTHALHKWQQVFEVLDYPGQMGRALLQEQVETAPHSTSVVLRDSQWGWSDCLQYLQLGEDSKPSASRAMTFLKTFRLLNCVFLGIQIPDALLCGPLLSGGAQRFYGRQVDLQTSQALEGFRTCTV